MGFEKEKKTKGRWDLELAWLGFAAVRSIPFRDNASNVSIKFSKKNP